MKFFYFYAASIAAMLTVLSCAAQPVAEDATIYITPDPQDTPDSPLRYVGILNPYASHGQQPYHFSVGSLNHLSGTQISINHNGSFSFSMPEDQEQGSFDYQVTDAQGDTSNEGVITIIRLFPKG